MKFSDFLKLTEAAQNLETALKSVREYIRKPNSGIGPEGKKTCEKIIDTLLASADDAKTFERYYNRFMADHPDAMDFVLDEVYAHMDVKDAQEFFAKAFNKSSAILGESTNICEQVTYIKKFEKNGIKYSLWQKGNYWHELTLSSQSGQGFKSVAEWHNKSAEDIEAELLSQGYKPIST